MREEILTQTKYFNAQLLDIAKKMQEMPVQNSQDFFREFDRLKITYFQFSGRASASSNLVFFTVSMEKKVSRC